MISLYDPMIYLLTVISGLVMGKFYFQKRAIIISHNDFIFDVLIFIAGLFVTVPFWYLFNGPGTWEIEHWLTMIAVFLVYIGCIEIGRRF